MRREMEISQPKIRCTLNMQKSTESNVFFGSSRTAIFVKCCSLFFKLLVNRSILDFVLDPGKRVTIESKREYARTHRHMNDRELTERLQLRGPMKFIFSSELTC